MQFTAVLCLETYDWFCADRSHIRSIMSVVIITYGECGY